MHDRTTTRVPCILRPALDMPIICLTVLEIPVVMCAEHCCFHGLYCTTIHNNPWLSDNCTMIISSICHISEVFLSVNVLRERPKEGRAVCDELLSTKEFAQMYAKLLAELAANLGFDQWLVIDDFAKFNLLLKVKRGEKQEKFKVELNMEVSLKLEQISNFKEFVNHLSSTTHSSVPGSLVIWYDSVTIYDYLRWQNQLNEYNKPSFDM